MDISEETLLFACITCALILVYILLSVPVGFLNVVLDWIEDKYSQLENITAIKIPPAEVEYVKSYLGRRRNFIQIENGPINYKVSQLALIITIISISIRRNKGLFQREYFVYNNDPQIKLLQE